MSLSKSSKASDTTLSKSVKIRSTCNACQQAKIRCGHERPTCRRCQKHKIDCVYSMSRRLGRPAKKRDSQSRLGQNGDTPVRQQQAVDYQENERKKSKPAKKKCDQASPESDIQSPNRDTKKAHEETRNKVHTPIISDEMPC